MNPRSTDCEADDLTTTPSRRYTDHTDTAQLAIFVRGVDCNFDIFEELLSIASLKDRIAGDDVFKAFKKVMEFNNLRFENLSDVATDAAHCLMLLLL